MSQQQAQEFSPQEMVDATDSFKKLLQSGGTLGPTLGITEDECEAMYQLGHGFYKQGHYRDAFKTFSQLVIWNHLEPRYVIALASACQMLGLHADALQHYMTATLALLDDPIPPFHCAECLIAMGRLPEAIESLELSLTLAGDEHPVVKARATALLAAAKGKLQ